MLVYVQNKDGKPLMPTARCGKVRRLLKTGKAVVVEQIPFTIRLCYDTTNYMQPITLGVDSGTKYIGLSATTERMELYASEVEIRSDIVKLIATRRELRHTRRGNKTRYRKPRFNNRKKEEEWIAPSIKEKINSHLRQIEFICKILPISKIIIELGSFDTQKMKNPDISGTEYQEGDQLGFWNVREYVLARDKHQCQYCKGKSKNPILNVHHIESRKTGGNSPGNLITLCETCHSKYHKGEIKLNVKRLPSLRDSAVMSTMKWRLYEELKSKYSDVSMTFGYMTKHNRIKYEIEKSHTSDAFVISKNFNAKQLPYYYKVILTRRHNRQIHKFTIYKGGVKRNNQTPFETRGFRLFDRVLLNGNIMFVTGRRLKGRFVVRDINYKNPIEITPNKLKLYRNKRNIIQYVTK